MKNKLVLTIATAAFIGAASLFAAGDKEPAVNTAPAPAEAKAAGDMKCHSTAKAAPAHGCCMAGGHADHAAAQTGDAGASCHKK
jgi:hypothetical protein